MTMLDERKPNGPAEPMTRATDARLARIEERLAEIVETGEQRVAVLRDAIADYTAAEWARRDVEICAQIPTLQKRIADLEHQLEQKIAVDRQVAEIAARLEERQARRDRGKITDGDFIQMIAQDRESARKEFKAAVAESQRSVETMLTTKLEASEQRVVQHTDQRIIGRDGQDADPEAVARFVGERIEEPLHEFIRAQVDTKLTALEQRLKAVPGRLPVVRIWRLESVTYEAEVVSYDGSLHHSSADY